MNQYNRSVLNLSSSLHSFTVLSVELSEIEYVQLKINLFFLGLFFLSVLDFRKICLIPLKVYELLNIIGTH